MVAKPPRLGLGNERGARRARAQAVAFDDSTPWFRTGQFVKMLVAEVIQAQPTGQEEEDGEMPYPPPRQWPNFPSEIESELMRAVPADMTGTSRSCGGA
eukprot:scaffold4274_cov376-Prasinococcus_capsulatus_cf.AAC.7